MAGPEEAQADRPEPPTPDQNVPETPGPLYDPALEAKAADVVRFLHGLTTGRIQIFVGESRVKFVPNDR